jgi:pilus assembly protein CpaB
MQSRVLAILIAVVLALVATVALVVYVNGADRRAIADQKPVYVYVAKKTIKQGTRGEDALNDVDSIERRPVASTSAVEGRIRSPEQLRNRFAAVDIVAGEQLLLKRWVGSEDVAGRRLLPIPEKHQALSIGLDLQRQVAGFVTPGDKVSMLITRPQGERGEETEFLLQNVSVLAVGTTALTNAASQGGGGRVNQGKGSQSLTAVTLAIKEQYVKYVVHAVEQGSIYLTLMPPNAEATDRGARVDNTDDIPNALE